MKNLLKVLVVVFTLFMIAFMFTACNDVEMSENQNNNTFETEQEVVANIRAVIRNNFDVSVCLNRNESDVKAA